MNNENLEIQDRYATATTGINLLLIAKSPLSDDKKRIFDSEDGEEYLQNVFKSKYKISNTHVTYINSNAEVRFAKGRFIDILSEYSSTLNTNKLLIAFIGEDAFKDFLELNSIAKSYTSFNKIYINEEAKLLKIDANNLSLESIILPYIVLPDITEKSLYYTISGLLDAKDIPADNTKGNTIEEVLDFIDYTLDLYKSNSIKYCIFNTQININTNKIIYFTITNPYIKVNVSFYPADYVHNNMFKKLLVKLNLLIKTVPFIGNDAEKIIQLFGNIGTIYTEELNTKIDCSKFEITGNINGSEISDWYNKWYKQVYLPKISKEISKQRASFEGYTPVKYEWIYDIEVFEEDWLFVAKTLDGKNKLICWNNPAKLRDWLHNKILIGFNNAAYDDNVIKHAIYREFYVPINKNKAIPTVKQYSDSLINDESPSYFNLKDEYKNIATNFLSWDISFHGPFDIRRNSLKKLTMAVLNRKNYDSNVAFDIGRRLTPAERDEVEKYCEMDVDNTLALFMQDNDNPKRTFAKESYDIRWNMIIEYAMKAKTLVNKSSSFAGKLLCGENATPNKLNTAKIVDGKLQYYAIPELAFKELAGDPVLEFYIKNQTNPYYIKESFEAYLGPQDPGHLYQFGFGGLHQALEKYHSRNLVNMDVASLYPSIIVRYKLMSRGTKHADFYEKLYHTRLAAKKEGKKLLSEGLKLILNGAIGAMLSQYNPLYDTWSNSSVCVHGQLLIYILAKRLFNAGFNIVQTNTDGIMIETQKDVDYMPICEKWQQETGLVLEFDEIAILQQNNVNNYYCQFVKGKVKSKGFYESNEKFGKATSKILCNMVTQKPLLENVEPRDFAIFKKHAIGEIYDGITRQKLEGRSLAFIIGYETDPRTQSYYSRSKNTRIVTKKNADGTEYKEAVNTESKITGFTEYMLLVDDINALTMDEINTSAYIALAKNLLNAEEEFGPYFNSDYKKTEDVDILQSLNQFKDNTALNPRNNNVICQNFLFECDYLSKEEQEELIKKTKNKLYRVVWSGNRSYHCIVRINKPVTVILYKKIWYYLKYKLGFIGADEQCAIPSKYTRVPDQINPKTGKLQTLYSYDKNILDTEEIINDLPKLHDEVKPIKLYSGEISLKALEKHINKQDWSEGNRFTAVQKLSPILISQVDINTLLEMIPVKLDKDHLYVIRSKYRWYEKHRNELETKENS